MNTAMIGLGKLGLPVSCAFASREHTVHGYESDLDKRLRYRDGIAGLYEPDIDELLARMQSCGRLSIAESLEEAVDPAEVIFIAVPTPSLPSHAFDAQYVKAALTQIAQAIRRSNPRWRLIALISTVLPGTCRAEFLPLLEQELGPVGDRYGFCYNAQFIAMGTTVDDALNPEFVLIGEYDERSGDMLARFYEETLRPMAMEASMPPFVRTTIETAELIKVGYNVVIGQKIVLGNTIMELCAKIPNTDCDAVIDAFSLATDRLISPKYLRGGLGDGGGCHPRDQRAMSYLSRKLELSADPFEFVTQSRLKQTDWMAGRIAQIYEDHGRHLPVQFLGAAFKPHTNLIDDSPGLLLWKRAADLIPALDAPYDPVAPGFQQKPPDQPSIYVIATAWPDFRSFPYHPGSVIVDPWGLLEAAPPHCRLDSVGRRR